MKSSFNKITMENTLNSYLIPSINQSNVSYRSTFELRNNPLQNVSFSYSKPNANVKSCACKSLSVNTYNLTQLNTTHENMAYSINHMIICLTYNSNMEHTLLPTKYPSISPIPKQLCIASETNIIV